MKLSSVIGRFWKYNQETWILLKIMKIFRKEYVFQKVSFVWHKNFLKYYILYCTKVHELRNVITCCFPSIVDPSRLPKTTFRSVVKRTQNFTTADAWHNLLRKRKREEGNNCVYVYKRSLLDIHVSLSKTK